MFQMSRVPIGLRLRSQLRGKNPLTSFLPLLPTGVVRDPRRGRALSPRRGQLPAVRPAPQPPLHRRQGLHHPDMEHTVRQGALPTVHGAPHRLGETQRPNPRPCSFSHFQPPISPLRSTTSNYVAAGKISYRHPRTPQSKSGTLTKDFVSNHSSS